MGSPRRVCPASVTVAHVVLLAALQGIRGITYVLDAELIDVTDGRAILRSAEKFITASFEQWSPHDQKPVKKITLSLDPKMLEPSRYQIAGKEAQIYIGEKYLDSLQSGEVTRQIFEALLIYEMTHILQWTGTADDEDCRALTEGIAAFMVLKRGYVPGGWAEKGEGRVWRQRKDVTARFLEYCEAVSIGFIARLNKRLQQPYTDQTFAQAMKGGHPIDIMWYYYKIQYSKVEKKGG